VSDFIFIFSIACEKSHLLFRCGIFRGLVPAPFGVRTILGVFMNTFIRSRQKLITNRVVIFVGEFS